MRYTHKGICIPANITTSKLIREMKLYLQTKLDDVQDTGINKFLLERIGLELKYKKRICIECKWDKPPARFTKLSCDGALNTHKAVCGGLLGDQHEELLRAYYGGTPEREIE
ncbi:hypothetical protein AQUCO_02800089v1 [Aquilegia coerulea]|uniref:Uncharacterized protein n=1 Tax=Aquilegia coerulea TaxID=218851 RepID=A0A2G5D3U7_AQUCA|nr:hypothetical protein AQUCO_02800089v1 [Aquilegia coerulea]